MKSIKTVRLVILLLLFVGYGFAQKPLTVSEKKTQTNVDKLFKHSYEKGLFNGTVLVTQNGKVVYKNAFGFSNKAYNKMLNTESSFYLASVSKQFTAMMIMILEEKGRLNYDDTLAEYFPQFPEYAKNITLKHLLTHTSGIPNHYRLGIYKPGLTNADVLEALLKEELDFPPGERYSYSNGGYVLLALIAERATAVPLHQLMNNWIFKPLGMTRTLVYHEKTPRFKNRAIGYNANGGLDDYQIFTTGAGGMFSTVEDLHKWDQALYTEALVSKATLQKAFTPTTLNNGEVSNYGYGWGIRDNNGQKSVMHSGSLAGYRTMLHRNLYDNSSYILLTNIGGGTDLGSIRTALTNILEGKSFELPKTPIAFVLRKSINETMSTEALSKKIKTLVKEKSEVYVADENRINSLGYSYLNANDIVNAMKVFSINVALFPKASNVYDSLGEAQLMQGDSINAIKNYKKSYKLSRSNTNAIEILKSIGVDTSKLTDAVKISEDVLKSYVGKYQLTPNLVLDISLKDGQLYIHPTGQQISPIFPSSKTRFYSKVVDAQATFNKDDNGKVISLTLHQNGDHLAPKID